MSSFEFWKTNIYLQFSFEGAVCNMRTNQNGSRNKWCLILGFTRNED